MPSPGDRFRDDVKALVERVIRELGLEERFRVVTEYPSPHGSVIREQGRKVDVAVLEREEGRPYLFLECKWQSGSGSAEDKLFRAAEEAKRDRLFGVHSVVVLGGEGFGAKMRRWALTEGFVHEAFLEAWLRKFFGG
ncbi:PD-(D/E)XK nuclease superfamily protein [Thermus caliditerrae]|uniref:PD-(D/E)XK nuclease superfamily protein n=1 Tax=Thermus caliditerrae TaxID=1330700 RepID=UPI001F311EF8|nr:PD-(D/E)XK nuclease superfamily protein [Thermus caliditerrae]